MNYICMFGYVNTHSDIHTIPMPLPIPITIHTYITLHYITLHYTTLHYITLHYITLHYMHLIYIIIYLYLFTCMRIQAHAPWWSSWHCESALRLGLNGRAKRAKAVDYRTYWDVTVTVIEKYPLVNQHSYGKSPFLMAKSTINGHFQ